MCSITLLSHLRREIRNGRPLWAMLMANENSDSLQHLLPALRTVAQKSLASRGVDCAMEAEPVKAEPIEDELVRRILAGDRLADIGTAAKWQVRSIEAKLNLPAPELRKTIPSTLAIQRRLCRAGRPRSRSCSQAWGGRDSLRRAPITGVNSIGVNSLEPGLRPSRGVATNRDISLKSTQAQFN